jgi:hypothetical protein
MSRETLIQALSPILDELSGIDPGDAEKAHAQLNTSLPLTDPRIQSLRRLFDEGVEAGWLCHRGEGNARFSRVSKPSPETKGFSIDAVRMSGPGVWHRHTAGEIELCFARTPGATFDGQPEGWVVYGPGTEHVPTVDGGEMDILYFLPQGQVEWKRGE